MSVTATTPPTTCRLGWHHQQAAGSLRATAATANTTSTIWTLTQTLTPTLHPRLPDPSTYQLRRAAPRPLPPSAPISICAPLLPHLAPTPHDPPTAWEACEEGQDKVASLVHLTSERTRLPASSLDWLTLSALHQLIILKCLTQGPCVPHSHWSLSPPSSQCHCWQTSGMTVYSVNINNINRNKSQRNYFTILFMLANPPLRRKHQSDTWVDVCMNDRWMDEWLWR